MYNYKMHKILHLYKPIHLETKVFWKYYLNFFLIDRKQASTILEYSPG